MGNNIGIASRAISIAYYKLIRYSKKVEAVKDCQFYDYIASTLFNTTKYAVKVFSTDISDSCFDDYINTLKQKVNSAKELMIPVIALFVNVNTGDASFNKLISRKYDLSSVVYCNNSTPFDWNEQNVNVYFLEIDNEISALPQSMWAFQKTITVTHDDFFECKIIYFRTFENDYKMHQRSCLTGVKQFNRMLNGFSEDEYPSDIIDTLILNAVKEVYSNTQVHTSMLVLNTDLRNLQHFTSYKQKNCKVVFVPTRDDFQNFISTHPNGNLPQITLFIAYQPVIRYNSLTSPVGLYLVECTTDDMSVVESKINTYIYGDKYLLK